MSYTLFCYENVFLPPTESKTLRYGKAIPLFFSFIVECAFWFWVGRSEKEKKQNKNKIGKGVWN